jgi:hypothetical protein
LLLLLLLLLLLTYNFTRDMEESGDQEMLDDAKPPADNGIQSKIEADSAPAMTEAQQIETNGSTRAASLPHAAAADTASAIDPDATVGAHMLNMQSVTLKAKYGKERLIVLEDLPIQLTILQVKELLQEETNILPVRQKLLGLKAGKSNIHDGTRLHELTSTSTKSSKNLAADNTIVHSCILMGTP